MINHPWIEDKNSANTNGHVNLTNVDLFVFHVFLRNVLVTVFYFALQDGNEIALFWKTGPFLDLIFR